MFDWLWCGVIILELSVISYYQTDREKSASIAVFNVIIRVVFIGATCLLHNEAESEVGGRSEPRVAFKGLDLLSRSAWQGPITF